MQNLECKFNSESSVFQPSLSGVRLGFGPTPLPPPTLLAACLVVSGSFNFNSLTFVFLLSGRRLTCCLSGPLSAPKLRLSGSAGQPQGPSRWAMEGPSPLAEVLFWKKV